MFWLRRGGRQMPSTEELLYQSDKWLYPGLESLFHEVPGPKACNFIKKRLQHMCFPADKFLRTPILKNVWVRLLLNYFRKWLYETLFLESRYQNHSDSLILQKYQSLSNQSFKHNLAQISSLDSTPTLSFEPAFRMFIINVYNTKTKRL